MKELTYEERVEVGIAKLNSIVSAHEDLIQKLLLVSGVSELAAIELIQKTKAEKYQKWLEFVEDADPALAAKIDDRDLDICP